MMISEQNQSKSQPATLNMQTGEQAGRKREKIVFQVIKFCFDFWNILLLFEKCWIFTTYFTEFFPSVCSNAGRGFSLVSM